MGLVKPAARRICRSVRLSCQRNFGPAVVDLRTERLGQSYPTDTPNADPRAMEAFAPDGRGLRSTRLAAPSRIAGPVSVKLGGGQGGEAALLREVARSMVVGELAAVAAELDGAVVVYELELVEVLPQQRRGGGRSSPSLPGCRWVRAGGGGLPLLGTGSRRRR